MEKAGNTLLSTVSDVRGIKTLAHGQYGNGGGWREGREGKQRETGRRCGSGWEGVRVGGGKRKVQHRSQRLTAALLFFVARRRERVGLSIFFPSHHVVLLKASQGQAFHFLRFSVY